MEGKTLHLLKQLNKLKVDEVMNYEDDIKEKLPGTTFDEAAKLIEDLANGGYVTYDRGTGHSLWAKITPKGRKVLENIK